MQGKSKTAAYVSLTKNCSGCNTISGNTRWDYTLDGVSKLQYIYHCINIKHLV